MLLGEQKANYSAHNRLQEDSVQTRNSKALRTLFLMTAISWYLPRKGLFYLKPFSGRNMLSLQGEKSFLQFSPGYHRSKINTKEDAFEGVGKRLWVGSRVCFVARSLLYFCLFLSSVTLEGTEATVFSEGVGFLVKKALP